MSVPRHSEGVSGRKRGARSQMLQPLPLFVWGLLEPLPAQRLALLRRKLLETPESVVQFLLLRGGERVVQMLILAGSRTLLRCHLLPSGDAVADFLLLLRGKLHPLLCPLKHVFLPARRKGAPLGL